MKSERNRPGVLQSAAQCLRFDSTPGRSKQKAGVQRCKRWKSSRSKKKSRCAPVRTTGIRKRSRKPGFLRCSFATARMGCGIENVRAGSVNLKDSAEAVCFPAACLTASSWDPALLRTLGAAIAEEMEAEGVSVILGPGAQYQTQSALRPEF